LNTSSKNDGEALQALSQIPPLAGHSCRQAARKGIRMSSSAKLWVGRISRGIITVALVAAAAMKISHIPKAMVEGITRAGIPETAILPIALLELTCLALYLIPRTTVLGAVLLTGYFGGAMVVHIIGRESVFPLILLGVWVWGGIYYRVPSLPTLLPLRKDLPAESVPSFVARAQPARQRT